MVDKTILGNAGPRRRSAGPRQTVPARRPRWCSQSSPPSLGLPRVRCGLPIGHRGAHYARSAEWSI